MREEEERKALFKEHRKFDLLDGRMKKVEKQVLRLSKLVDPKYLHGGINEGINDFKEAKE